LVNDTIERSATISCPEAARIALLNPEKLEFVEKEEVVVKKRIIGQKLTPDTQTDINIEMYFWELRIFIIEVLHKIAITF
jgi:lysine-N-methylase